MLRPLRRNLRVPGSQLWARAALRRPGRGLLVVAGLVAMSVATVASLVAGDSLETLFLADVQAQWGDVDVVTSSPGDAVMGESLARMAGLEGAGADGAFAARLVLNAVTSTNAATTEPRARVLGVSAEEENFHHPLVGDGQLVPTDLQPEEVIVNRRLARRVDAAVGDVLTLTIAVPEVIERRPTGQEIRYEPHVATWKPTVAGIAEDEGLADFGRTPNLITRLDSLQRVASLPGLVTALHVRAPEPGRDAAEDLTDAFAEVDREFGLLSVEAKEDALDIARDEGGLFRGILMTLALLVIIGSAVVTGNLVVLLGQERAREVAVLRAVGARRQVVARLFTLEAGLYAVVAALVGAVLAIPVAGLLASAIADHFAGINAGRGREQLDLVLQARPLTVVAGVVAVLAVSLLTIRSAARRVSGLATDEVLRGSTPTLGAAGSGARRTTRTRTAGVLLLGMGITASGGADLLRFLGLSLLLAAWWLSRRQRLLAGPQRRRLDERAALGGLAWCVVAPALLGDFAQGVQSSFGLLTLAGAGAVTCATVLAAARMPAIMRVIRLQLPGQRTQAPLRTAGSYAALVPSRTGTVVGTIGGVLFMVAALAVLGSATDIGAARQAGGYDVIGSAPVQVDVEQLTSTRGVVHVDAMAHVDMGESWFQTRDDDDDETASVPYPVRAIRLEAPFVAAQGFSLIDSVPRFTTAEEALAAAQAGQGVVIDRYARPEGAQPGDDVVIDDGRGPVTHELLGVLDTFVLNGVLMGPEDFDVLFDYRGPTLVLARGRDGVMAQDLASDLAAAASARGLVADPVAVAADEVVRINRTFTDIFALMLQLGLVVALVAVAVLVARSVRERRAHLAIARALGFSRRDIVVLLLAEPLLEALTGVAIGLGAGLGVLWLLFTRGFADLAFVVGWARLGTTTAAVLALVVLASLGPALGAARREVAADLRDLG